MARDLTRNERWDLRRLLADGLRHAAQPLQRLRQGWHRPGGALRQQAGRHRHPLGGSAPGGLRVIAYDRGHGHEKKIDTGIATEMASGPLDYKLDPSDRFVLVGGDRDFVPPVLKLKSWGYEVTVVFWDHASRELVEAASTFRSLNNDLHRLTR